MRKQPIVSKILRSFCFYIVFILARITNEYNLNYYLFSIHLALFWMSASWKSFISSFCSLVPSKAPADFAVNARSSTSVRASWQKPPEDSRNGIITGFKLFYKEKGSGAPQNELTISSGSTLTKDVTGLEMYREYNFEVLAFTSIGDGPKSDEKTVKTREDGKKYEEYLSCLQC